MRIADKDTGLKLMCDTRKQVQDGDQFLRLTDPKEEMEIKRRKLTKQHDTSIHMWEAQRADMCMEQQLLRRQQSSSRLTSSLQLPVVLAALKNWHCDKQDLEDNVLATTLQ